LEITNFINSRLNESEYVAGAFLDLQKAFDTINHSFLLSKLDLIGFRGTSYKLIDSYLSGRCQFVDIDGVRSSSNSIHIGVPQGSVLGPLFYLIYINDIIKLSLPGQLYLFADDTAYFEHCTDTDYLKNSMSKSLDILANFFDANKLKLNISKCSVVYFSSSRRISQIDSNDLSIKNQKLKVVSEVRYLGLI
jgi:hypothetical protein